MTPTIDFQPSVKQDLAYQYLEDNTTTELLFGGSISGGKTRLACYWVILSCLKYAGSRYLIGRARLKTLKATTLKTFFDILKEWKLEKMVNYNQKDDIIYFKNGSEVVVMDLFQQPSDPDFVKLGSLELTGAVVDEAGEVSERVYTILKTRLRYKLKEFGLLPKLLVVSNPAKNWLFNVFYKPSESGDLPEHRKFIQSLPNDNPYNSQDYLNSLTIDNLGASVYNRLVLGDWNYSNEDNALFNYDQILGAFYRKPQIMGGTRYISCDPAAEGKDSTVICVWYGWHCAKIVQLDVTDTQQTVDTIKLLMHDHNVNIQNVVVDKVGIGQGVFDLLRGCKGFIANATALRSEPYKSLKDQCYYVLAKAFVDGHISIEGHQHRDEITQELEAHSQHNADLDQKAAVTPKRIVKQMIGRSPDFSDALMMRCYFATNGGGKIRILRG